MNSDEVIIRVIQVELLEYIDRDKIDCREIPMGYFSTILHMKKFLKDHGNRRNCFYIVEEWALNPCHRGQCETDLCFSVYMYDEDMKEMSLYDKLRTKKFIYQHNRLDDQLGAVFKGRKEEELKLKKGDQCWYYDRFEKILYLGEILGEPVYEDWQIPTLDWYDDSYMIKSGEMDHTHISTPLVFPENMFLNLKLDE